MEGNIPPAAKITDEQAKAFCDELTALCQRHGIFVGFWYSDPPWLLLAEDCENSVEYAHKQPLRGNTELTWRDP